MDKLTAFPWDRLVTPGEIVKLEARQAVRQRFCTERIVDMMGLLCAQAIPHNNIRVQVRRGSGRIACLGGLSVRG